MAGRKTRKSAAKKNDETLSILSSNGKVVDKEEIANRVFWNPLLLDKIVEYSVCKFGQKQINEEIVLSIRLVGKVWLASASRILQKHCTSPKSLSPVLDTVFSGICYLNKKVINNFVSVFSENVRLENSILPLSLQLKPYHFVKENHATFNKLFLNCGDLICKLAVDFPLNGGSMSFEFDRLNLTNLNDFEFSFEGDFSGFGQPITQNIQTNGRIFGSNINGWTFLYKILQQAIGLKSFIFKLGKQHDPKHTANVESLKLPASIKHLHLQCRLSSVELILTTNKFPALEALHLDSSFVTEEEEHPISNILEKFRLQLKTFYFKRGPSLDNDDIICIKFPRMERLTTLRLIGGDVEFNPKVEQNFPQIFPNLIFLELSNPYKSQLLKCIDGNKFKTVKILLIVVRNRSNVLQEISNRMFLRQIRISFPRIHSLKLCLDFSETTCLTYIFQYFANLKWLHLNFEGDCDNFIGYVLSSVLLGISRADAETISKTKKHNVRVSTDNPNSIMNLKELKSLTLETAETSQRALRKDFYETRQCKKFGFNKMPQLKTVKYLDGFKNSAFAWSTKSWKDYVMTDV